MIELTGVTRSFGAGAEALRDVTLRVGRGEFVCLAGPSGAGKSTLLRLLLREDVPTSGTVRVDGVDLATLSRTARQTHRRSVGFVFQAFRLLPTRTIFENVATIARVMGVPTSQQWRRASALLQQVGLQHRMNDFPRQLSGGEQQRVAIARALMNTPALLLADEPTGNLDRDLSLEVMDIFRDINASGTTVLVATHDRALIDHVGRRVVSLERGRLVGDSGVGVGQDPPRPGPPPDVLGAPVERDAPVLSTPLPAIVVAPVVAPTPLPIAPTSPDPIPDPRSALPDPRSAIPDPRSAIPDSRPPLPDSDASATLAPAPPDPIEPVPSEPVPPDPIPDPRSPLPASRFPLPDSDPSTTVTPESKPDKDEQ